MSTSNIYSLKNRDLKVIFTKIKDDCHWSTSKHFVVAKTHKQKVFKFYNFKLLLEKFKMALI